MTLLQSILSKFRKPGPPAPTRYEVLAGDIMREIEARRAKHLPVKHLQRELKNLVCEALSGKFRDAMKGAR